MMHKKNVIFCSALAVLLLTSQAFANSEDTAASNTPATVSDNLIKPEDINSEATDQPEFEIIRKVDKSPIALPACDDATLISKTNDFISSFFASANNKSTMFRRRQYFILHNLDKFAKENIANYKTSQSRPVSDIIADIKVNHGIDEDNMLLCKNQSNDKYAGDVYLIITLEGDIYKVYVINLVDNQSAQDVVSFSYQADNLISKK